MRKFDLSVYFVADPECCAGRSIIDIVKEAAAGGVTMVQYRNKAGAQQEHIKDAQAIAQFLKPLKIPFIVNDDVLLARHVGADGVHLGQGDMSPVKARNILGRTKIIGVTAFKPEHFSKIDPHVVDYAGTGPFYSTQTKPDKPVLGAALFAALVRQSAVPVVGIGGITPDNAAAVIRAGAKGVAMMRAISEHPEPRRAAQAFVKVIKLAKGQGYDDSEHPQHRRI